MSNSESKVDTPIGQVLNQIPEQLELLETQITQLVRKLDELCSPATPTNEVEQKKEQGDSPLCLTLLGFRDNIMRYRRTLSGLYDRLEI